MRGRLLFVGVRRRMFTLCVGYCYASPDPFGAGPTTRAATLPTTLPVLAANAAMTAATSTRARHHRGVTSLATAPRSSGRDKTGIRNTQIRGETSTAVSPARADWV